MHYNHSTTPMHSPDMLRHAEPPRTIGLLLAEAGIRVNGDAPWDMQVLDNSLYQRILLHGSLGLGEAYMDGLWEVERLDEFFHRLLRRALGSNHCCKLPLWIRREGKRRTDLLLLGYHATFGIIRIASRRKGVAMMPNRTAGTSPVVQCGRMKLCCNRCTSRVRCSASAFLA